MGKLRVRSSTSDRSIDEHDASENNLTWMQKASHRPTLPVGMLGQAFTRTSENISSKPGPKKKTTCSLSYFPFWRSEVYIATCRIWFAVEFCPFRWRGWQKRLLGKEIPYPCFLLFQWRPCPTPHFPRSPLKGWFAKEEKGTNTSSHTGFS